MACVDALNKNKCGRWMDVVDVVDGKRLIELLETPPDTLEPEREIKFWHCRSAPHGRGTYLAAQERVKSN